MITYHKEGAFPPAAKTGNPDNVPYILLTEDIPPCRPIGRSKAARGIIPASDTESWNKGSVNKCSENGTQDLHGMMHGL